MLVLLDLRFLVALRKLSISSLVGKAVIVFSSLAEALVGLVATDSFVGLYLVAGRSSRKPGDDWRPTRLSVSAMSEM